MLVKSWLLALPHLLIVSVFVGGAMVSFGLIALLVFIAAVVLLFTGQYPRTIYDFVMGMNRWVYRVAAYTALMTDQYPPFRLDQGGDEPTIDSAQAPIQPTPVPMPS